MINIVGAEITDTYLSGLPSALLLKVDTLVRGILFKANTTLYFYESGGVKRGTLAENKSINVKQLLLTFAAGSVISFNENANVVSGVLASDLTISKPYWLTVAKGPIEFYSDGSIAVCKVLEQLELEIEGNKYKTYGNQGITFYPITGIGEQQIVSIKSAIFTQEIRTIRFKILTGVEVSFYEGPGPSISYLGAIQKFVTAYQCIEQGFVIKDKSTIYLHKNGSLSLFEISEPTTINNINLKPDSTTIGLYDNGKLKSIFSSYEVFIGTIQFSPYAKIEFDLTGNITH